MSYLARYVGSIAARLAILAIMAFQALVRPFMAGTCRYCPSCSHFAIEAIQVHGVVRGVRLSISRLMRCRPFALGGWDPVPRPDDRNQKLHV